MPKTKKRPPARAASSANGLSAKELGLIEKELIKERERVLRSSSELSALVDSAGSSVSGDVVDVSSVSVTRENASILASRATQQFRLIDAALKRIREAPESFGICQTCGGPIGFGRLDFLPTTQVCSADAQ